jgi:hypothetical protein
LQNTHPVFQVIIQFLFLKRETLVPPESQSI